MIRMTVKCSGPHFVAKPGRLIDLMHISGAGREPAGSSRAWPRMESTGVLKLIPVTDADRPAEMRQCLLAARSLPDS